MVDGDGRGKDDALGVVVVDLRALLEAAASAAGTGRLRFGQLFAQWHDLQDDPSTMKGRGAAAVVGRIRVGVRVMLPSVGGREQTLREKRRGRGPLDRGTNVLTQMQQGAWDATGVTGVTGGDGGKDGKGGKDATVLTTVPFGTFQHSISIEPSLTVENALPFPMDIAVLELGEAAMRASSGSASIHMHHLNPGGVASLNCYVTDIIHNAHDRHNKRNKHKLRHEDVTRRTTVAFLRVPSMCSDWSMPMSLTSLVNALRDSTQTRTVPVGADRINFPPPSEASEETLDRLGTCV